MELKELNVKRSSVKGQITKFKNFISNISQQKELTSIELTELKLKLGKFEALFTRFDDLQSEIEVCNSDNLLKELDERESIEHEFVVHIATAKNVIEKHSKMESFQRRESSFHDASASSSFDDKDNGMGIKLPQIQIAKFDGAYFRWLEFHDTFVGLIQNNNRISPIHKFHYLVSYLEGEAARVIANLEISTSNYAEAWKLLCDRYNNKRLLTNHHLHSLFNIQTLTRESERSLRFLVDHVTKNLRALASLGQPTDKWDMLLIYMLSSKLDGHTLTKWEEYRNTLEDIPTLNQFNKFLTDRADVLESINRNKYDTNNLSKKVPTNLSKNLPTTSRSYAVPNNNTPKERVPYTKSFATMNLQQTKTYLCIICGENHRIYDCSTFKSKGIQERLADIKKYKLCSNCLRQGHPLSECRMGPCRECKKRHNSLLHDPTTTLANSTVVDESNPETVANFSHQNQKQVLLSTALIEVINPITNKIAKVRALLDCGSQSSFVTKSLRDKLALKSTPIDALKVIGIGNNCSNHVVETCTTQIKSLNTSFSVQLSCFVLNELTSEVPKALVDIKALNLPSNILLADPNFHQPASIDVLIGADVFWDILGNEQRSLGPENPKLHSSKLGWLISGPMHTKHSYNAIHCNHMLLSNSHNESIDKMLTKFWDLEEVPTKPIMSENDKDCEKHFITHTTRNKSGRFCVKLSLKDTPDCLGDTYQIAKRRFIAIEKKFKRDPVLKIEYTKFINEYAELGHLSVSNNLFNYSPTYYLCHHAVLKQESESTKLRVVFNGSAHSTSGYSLNDILKVGPNLQNSLFSILLRARQYKYLLTGDIEKMYRQVLVHEDDCNLQLILWREDESRPIKTLKLGTLTYGTASASYLSTRCLWQVGEDQDDELIKSIIQNDFYVDDLITGCDDQIQLKYIQNSVSVALKSACFNLRKYKSNCPSIFDNVDINKQDNLTISESSSTLGLGWTPSSDTLHFPIKGFSHDINDSIIITKRFIMSNSFKIFDPLGLLSPIVIKPKIMLQKLWQQRLDWDEPVPQDIKDDWTKFAANLKYLSNFKVPRLVLGGLPNYIELHSFSDASLSAYGACIYMKSISPNGDVTIRLLCAKSKVAPLKPTTIPRLELCGALLAAKLCKSVLESLRQRPGRMIHWCDSSIVLAWIHNDPKKLKTFVANRIIEITEITKSTQWRYVPTALNPADLISRGLDAIQLVSMNLWWFGPEFLSLEESDWPILNKASNIDILPETKSNTIAISENSEPIIPFEKYSTYNKLQRSFAYVKRFIYNLKNPTNKLSNSLSLEELNNSFLSLCALAQYQSFSSEYDLLSKNKALNTKSKLLSLSPFLDQNNLIRVGGRLDASNYAYEKKHPILLHSSHHLTKLLFEREHLRQMHAGPQLLLATVRETVWPVNGRRLARRVVNNCVRCRRIQGKTLSPKMGNLPVQRITPNHPFMSIGLDFAGPFHILNRKGRGSRLIKCYLCLFICLRYKCLHLEAVSDLSKDAFVMTLRRFIARRGKPAEVFCDNGTNFVAAAKEFGQFLKLNKKSLSDFANQEGIKFFFSPAYAPHFGGIWEAGVKSAKYHVKRVIGNSHLTFEEISTLFAQVEAILNSRPLCPLSSSPNDLLSLSPGHFLIGRPLSALPSPNLLNSNENHLKRYERLEKLRQHFWNRWQKEYIGELQQRTKWRTNTGKLKIGDMVLLQEDYVPPLNWRLGRVARLFPGPDGISRVADVNTARGCVRRPLVRICPLPTEDELQR